MQAILVRKNQPLSLVEGLNIYDAVGGESAVIFDETDISLW